MRGKFWLVVSVIFCLACSFSPFVWGGEESSFEQIQEKAKNGDADSQFALGEFYSSGENVPQDYIEAAKWYRMAAEQGDADAQNRLGVMYANGTGVLQDFSEAAKWFRMAAEQGHADAQNNLGVKYLNGEGVPRNLLQAYMWFNLASVSGSNEHSNKNREIAASKMTPAQIAEAQRLSSNWKPKK